MPMDDRAELADTVVQGIVRARWALDGGDLEAVEAALADALADARRLLTALTGQELSAGDLRRKGSS
jgi:hypothetical protein